MIASPPMMGIHLNVSPPAASSHLGVGKVILAVGGGAGAGSRVECMTGHECDSVSGTVILTTGTNPATGMLGEDQLRNCAKPVCELPLE
jgi:hypothetical protein